MNAQPDLLRGLTEEQVERVLALGMRTSVASGTDLFSLGGNAECVYLISRGRIRLTLPMKVRGSDEDVLVEERCAGQTIGWSALTPPHRFTLKATAPLDAEVICLPRKKLHEYFAAHPAVGVTVALNLAAVVGERLQLFQTMWLREIQRTIELTCA